MPAMHVPVRRRSPWRRAVLFLMATFVPCAVLVALGLWAMEQERQLQAKRVFEERERFVDQVRQALLSQLEKTKLEQVTTRAVGGTGAARSRPDPMVAFVAPILNGRLQLPWENNPDAKKFEAWLNEGSFAANIRDAEGQELVTHQFETAARRYREAIDAAREPGQQVYARLLLARTLQKAGHRRQSEAEYEQVLASPPDLVDEQGVPLGLYAAPPLLQIMAKQNRMLEWIRFASDPHRPLPPAALRMARDVAAALGSSDRLNKLAELIRDREQAEALQADLARLLPEPQNREPIWAAYGNPAWLVSVTAPAGDSNGIVIAVRAAETLGHLSSVEGPMRVAPALEPEGASLGETFPGLRLILPSPHLQKTSSRQTLLLSALVLALLFTLLAGFLLWRDVQRDLRLAEMRSQFVSSVTHELKTPLTAIRMFTETLRLDDEVDRQTRLDYLDTILHESERLSRLVDNVLDFGKIEKGKKTYRFQPVHLVEVVEQAARAAQYPLEQAGFALEVVTDPDLPEVSADSDALQQAILNLLTNAMKYSGSSRRIALRLDQQNGHARIQVVDHGVGIAAEEQKRIFESFYRAPTVENQQIPGTGLGLTIVAHIAKAHGGEVQVVSRVGGGSSFTITFALPGEQSA